MVVVINAYTKFEFRNLEEMEHFGDLIRDGRITLE
jgi:hypothetical protein